MGDFFKAGRRKMRFFGWGWIGLLILSAVNGWGLLDTGLEAFSVEARPMDDGLRVEVERALQDARSLDLGESFIDNLEELRWAEAYDRGVLAYVRGKRILEVEESLARAWPWFERAFSEWAQSTYLEASKRAYIEAAISISQLEPNAQYSLMGDEVLLRILNSAIGLVDDAEETRRDLLMGKANLLKRLARSSSLIREWGETLKEAVSLDPNLENAELHFEYGKWLESFGRYDAMAEGLSQNQPHPTSAVELYEGLLGNEALGEPLRLKVERQLNQLKQSELVLGQIPQFPSDSNLYLPIEVKNADRVFVGVYRYQASWLQTEDSLDYEKLLNSLSDEVRSGYSVYEKWHDVEVAERYVQTSVDLSLEQSFPVGLYLVGIRVDGLEPQYGLLNVSNLLSVLIPFGGNQFAVWVYDVDRQSAVESFEVYRQFSSDPIPLAKHESSDLPMIEWGEVEESAEWVWIKADEQFSIVKVEDSGVSEQFISPSVLSPKTPIQDLSRQGPVYEVIPLENETVQFFQKGNAAEQLGEARKTGDLSCFEPVFKKAGPVYVEGQKFPLYSIMNTKLKGEIRLDKINDAIYQVPVVSGNVVSGTLDFRDSISFGEGELRLSIYESGELIKVGEEWKVNRYGDDLKMGEGVLANTSNEGYVFQVPLDSTLGKRIYRIEVITTKTNELLAETSFVYKPQGVNFEIDIDYEILPVGSKLPIGLSVLELSPTIRESGVNLHVFRKELVRQYIHRRKGAVITAKEYHELPDRSLMGSTKGDYRLFTESVSEEEVFQERLSFTDWSLFREVILSRPGFYEIKLLDDVGMELSSSRTFWVYEENKVLGSPDDLVFEVTYSKSLSSPGKVEVIVQGLSTEAEFLILYETKKGLSVRRVEVGGRAVVHAQIEGGALIAPSKVMVIAIKRGEFYNRYGSISRLNVKEGDLIELSKSAFTPGESVTITPLWLEEGQAASVDLSVLTSGLAYLKGLQSEYQISHSGEGAAPRIISSIDQFPLFDPSSLSVRRNQGVIENNSSGMNLHESVWLTFPELSISQGGDSNALVNERRRAQSASESLSFSMPSTPRNWKLVLNSWSIKEDNLYLERETIDVSTQVPLRIEFSQPSTVRVNDVFQGQVLVENVSPLPVDATLSLSFFSGAEEMLYLDESKFNIVPDDRATIPFKGGRKSEGTIQVSARVYNEDFDFRGVSQVEVLPEFEPVSSGRWALLGGQSKELGLDPEKVDRIELYASAYSLAETLRSQGNTLPRLPHHENFKTALKAFLVEYRKFHDIELTGVEESTPSANAAFDSLLAEFSGDLVRQVHWYWAIRYMANRSYRNESLESELNRHLLENQSPNELAKLLWFHSLLMSDDDVRLSRLSSRIYLQLIQGRDQLGLDGLSALYSLSRLLGFDEEEVLLYRLYQVRSEAGGLIQSATVETLLWTMTFLNSFGDLEEEKNRLMEPLIPLLGDFSNWRYSLRMNTLLTLYHQYHEEQIRSREVYPLGDWQLGEAEGGRLMSQALSPLVIEGERLELLKDHSLRFLPESKNHTVFARLQLSGEHEFQDDPIATASWELSYASRKRVPTLLAGDRLEEARWRESEYLQVGDEWILRIKANSPVSEGTRVYVYLPGFLKGQAEVDITSASSAIRSTYLSKQSILLLEWQALDDSMGTIQIRFPVAFAGVYQFPPLLLRFPDQLNPVELGARLELRVR